MFLLREPLHGIVGPQPTAATRRSTGRCGTSGTLLYSVDTETQAMLRRVVNPH